MNHINVSELIQRNKLYSEKDEERDCTIFDEDAVIKKEKVKFPRRFNVCLGRWWFRRCDERRRKYCRLSLQRFLSGEMVSVGRCVKMCKWCVIRPTAEQVKIVDWEWILLLVCGREKKERYHQKKSFDNLHIILDANLCLEGTGRRRWRRTSKPRSCKSFSMRQRKVTKRKSFTFWRSHPILIFAHNSFSFVDFVPYLILSADAQSNTADDVEANVTFLCEWIQQHSGWPHHT